jgi:hypothetical protein
MLGLMPLLLDWDYARYIVFSSMHNRLPWQHHTGRCHLHRLDWWRHLQRKGLLQTWGRVLFLIISGVRFRSSPTNS